MRAGPRVFVALVVLASGWSVLAGARAALRVPSGLRVDYFTDVRADAKPARTLVTANLTAAHLAANWSHVPPERFRARWYGYLTVRAPGSYVFALISDDGSVLSIDGRVVVDNGGVHEAVERRGLVHLDEGAHFVLIEYEQAGGRYALGWQWGRTTGDATNADAGERLDAVPGWILSTNRVPYWRLMAARVVDGLKRATAWLLALCTAWLLATTGRPRVLATVARGPRAACLLLFATLAVMHTWPLAMAPGVLSRNDNADTMLNQWTMAWVAHQAVRDPLALFQANIFYPARDTLAFSEPLIVQAALAGPVLWSGGSPVLAYSLVLMAGFALTGWAMAWVVQRWTGSWTAGLTSGVLYAFNAHTLTRLPHMQAQHVYFLPLAMLAIDALLREPSVRRALRLALWFVLQALTSIHLLVFSALALTAAAVARPEDWLGRRFLRTAACLSLAAAVAAVALLPVLLPYWRLRTQGLTRTFVDAMMYSAAWADYTTTPSRIHRAWWVLPTGGTGLFPGVTALLLSGVAIGCGAAWRDRRARMCLAAGVSGVVLSFGARLPGYETLHQWVPLLQAIRAPVRFGYLGIFAVAVVAGFGMAEVNRRLSGRTRVAVTAALLFAATFEPLAAPLSFSRFEGIPGIYDRLRSETDAVVLEVPFHTPQGIFLNAPYMLASTRHWQPMLAGYSGFVPFSYRQHFELFGRFPDGGALQGLDAVGVTHVVVHLDRYPPDFLRELEGLPMLELLAADGSIALFRVRPKP